MHVGSSWNNQWWIPTVFSFQPAWILLFFFSWSKLLESILLLFSNTSSCPAPIFILGSKVVGMDRTDKTWELVPLYFAYCPDGTVALDNVTVAQYCSSSWQTDLRRRLPTVSLLCTLVLVQVRLIDWNNNNITICLYIYWIYINFERMQLQVHVLQHPCTLYACKDPSTVIY